MKHGPKAFADAVRKHKGLLLTGTCSVRTRIAIHVRRLTGMTLRHYLEGRSSEFVGDSSAHT